VVAILVLFRHGEIVRPMGTSNFDRAPLSERGQKQIEALAAAWPADPPETIFASPLRRSYESSLVLARSFRRPIVKRACLKEWSPDESGIPQDEYMALERRAWADLDYVPPSRESLAAAGERGRTCLEAIGDEQEGRTVAISGHGTLFSLVIARLRGERPTEAYKNSIGFGHAAMLEAGSGLRLVRDFRSYGHPIP
jgi:broad specificity phosphatase PhoE